MLFEWFISFLLHLIYHSIRFQDHRALSCRAVLIIQECLVILYIYMLVASHCLGIRRLSMHLFKTGLTLFQYVAC